MKNDGTEDVDRAVSSGYRALADDRAPERLDRLVIEAARNDLGTRGTWRDNWYRPVALAATVGLALAVVLHLGDPSLTGPAANGIPTAPPSADLFEQAGRATEERLRELEAETDRSMPSSAAPEAAQTAGESPAGTGDGNLPSESTGCSEEDRRDPATWWACVTELERKGASRAAEAELQALLLAFPSFEAPE